MLAVALVKEHAMGLHGLAAARALGNMISAVVNFVELWGLKEFQGALFVFIGAVHISDVSVHLH